MELFTVPAQNLFPLILSSYIVPTLGCVVVTIVTSERVSQRRAASLKDSKSISFSKFKSLP